MGARQLLAFSATKNVGVENSIEGRGRENKTGWAPFSTAKSRERVVFLWLFSKHKYGQRGFNWYK